MQDNCYIVISTECSTTNNVLDIVTRHDLHYSETFWPDGQKKLLFEFNPTKYLWSTSQDLYIDNNRPHSICIGLHFQNLDAAAAR